MLVPEKEPLTRAVAPRILGAAKSKLPQPSEPEVMEMGMPTGISKGEAEEVPHV
jgi:hypothetical protein